ncbi:MAG: hypothetical protein LBT08_10205 [Synergistaceae bacterium]|jgi:predicted Fe-Mo cluster-binding NifX family protein|nr:hypothetical protein [Synergistaceae bacterium]
MKAAAASSDGISISEHFGTTPEFLIIEIDGESGTWSIVERRRNAAVECGASHERAVESLGDCRAVFASKIGPHMRNALERRGIQALEITGPIDAVLEKYVAYLRRKRVIN